jgi:hypothetical protein
VVPRLHIAQKSFTSQAFQDVFFFGPKPQNDNYFTVQSILPDLLSFVFDLSFMASYYACCMDVAPVTWWSAIGRSAAELHRPRAGRGMIDANGWGIAEDPFF